MHNALKVNFEWLALEAQDQASVDTLAKKIFLKEEYDKYNRLKKTLTSFFLICQMMNRSVNNHQYKKVDKRYDLFFASLHPNDRVVEFGFKNAHLKIVTWNYDSQFELSYMGFLKDLGGNRAITADKELNISLKLGPIYKHY